MHISIWMNLKSDKSSLTQASTYCVIAPIRDQRLEQRNALCKKKTLNNEDIWSVDRPGGSMCVEGMVWITLVHASVKIQ